MLILTCIHSADDKRKNIFMHRDNVITVNTKDSFREVDAGVILKGSKGINPVPRNKLSIELNPKNMKWSR